MDVLWIQCCVFAVLLVAVNSQPLDVPISRNSLSETDKIPPVVQVINGSPVTHGTIPGQALILYTYLCGGTLIAQNFVLTAAHCFDPYTPADIPYIRIYFNTVVRKPLDSESVVRSIDIHWLHPKYDPLAELPQSDIALIRLDKPVRNLPFVPIATRVGNLVGQAATVYGFGIFETFDPNIDPPRSSIIMLRGETTILDKNTCAQIHGSEMVDPQYVCAIGTQNSCNGDSGGPLISNGLQVGIVSFGVGGCNLQYPVVYTNVAVYADWIQAIAAGA